jgi:large subunit ribosomal protein L34e
MVQRVTYRRHNNFNTKSNKTKMVKTPGGRLTLHNIKKAAKGPTCGDCKGKIAGIPCLPSFHYRFLAKCERTVSRAYGGSRCMQCTRDRIKRAFFLEEQKAVKALIAEKEVEAKKAETVKAKASVEKKKEKKSKDKKTEATKSKKK